MNHSIISVLKLSSSHSILTNSVTSTGYDIVPGWNEYVKEHHSLAEDALWWRKLNNKPRHGQIYDNGYIHNYIYIYIYIFVIVCLLFKLHCYNV